MAMAARLLALLWYVHAAACASSLATALTVKVPANDGVCFYEKARMEGERGYLHFQVATGGRQDVDVEILAPDGESVWDGSVLTEEKVLFNAPMEGVYQFCFSNKMSTRTQKTVAFDIAIGDPTDDDEGKAPHDAIEKSIIRLTEGLNEVKMEQMYVATRERIHRKTAESTASRVFWSSVLEAAMLLTMGGCQIYYLRKQFETKRYV
eukprot:TRINITY_DN16343_c0_g1_i1.p1 TRINITY_DN16343_c0_g1~~TRINITY_DN16343_c0_g1_i1.p1  ORF type:complete len:207 (+),score=62.78 TRINITY_DN16343_c0_g1_i1:237-857(+)